MSQIYFMVTVLSKCCTKTSKYQKLQLLYSRNNRLHQNKVRLYTSGGIILKRPFFELSL